MEDKLVELTSFWSVEEAYVIKNRLEAEGIEVFLSGEHVTGMLWHFSNATGGVKLHVAEQDVDWAIRVLNQEIEEPPTTEITNQKPIDVPSTSIQERSPVQGEDDQEEPFDAPSRLDVTDEKPFRPTPTSSTDFQEAPPPSAEREDDFDVPDLDEEDEEEDYETAMDAFRDVSKSMLGGYLLFVVGLFLLSALALVVASIFG